MTDITYETTAQDVATRSFKVTVPLDRVAAAERRAVKEYTQRVRLPGFRKGHAPEPVVRRRFSDEIRQAALQEAVREGWDHLLKTADLKPIADPRISEVSYEADQPIEFDVTVDVRPELELKTVGGFELTRRVSKVDDELVENEIDRIREDQATWVPAEGADVRAQPGDLVSVTVENLTGEAPSEPAEPHRLVLGRGEAIPDLEDRIMALALDETSESEVNLPAERAATSELGTSRRVRITLHEIKHQQLPELDDEFAESVLGKPTMTEARTTIRSALERRAQEEADKELHHQLIEKIAEANEVKAPPSLVSRVVSAYSQRLGGEATNSEELINRLHPVAVAQVVRELVISAVATAQNVQADMATIDERIKELAEQEGEDPGKLYATLEREGHLADLEANLVEEATIKWLLEQSTVTEETA